MNKRKTKKAAYKLIYKENVPHQEAFDQLREQSDMGPEELAGEISATPSKQLNQSKSALWYTFIGVLATVMVLRVLGVIFISQENDLNATAMLIIILISTVVPIVGIIGAFTARMQSYRIVGILIALSTFRSFTKGELQADAPTIITYSLFIAAIALAFYIPTKLKTPYTKKAVKTETDGKVKTRLEFTFEKGKISGDAELLDTF